LYSDADDAAKNGQRGEHRHHASHRRLGTFQRNGSQRDIDNQQQHFGCQPTVHKRVLMKNEREKDGGAQERGINQIREDSQPAMVRQRIVCDTEQPPSAEEGP